MVSAELVNVSSSREDAPQFRPKLKYEYSVHGKTFRSTVLGISDSAFDFRSENEAEEFAATVSPGRYVDVLVNPAVPHDVFLSPGESGMRRNHYATAIAPNREGRFGGMLECRFGWVFFYDSKRHRQTGDFRDHSW